LFIYLSNTEVELKDKNRFFIPFNVRSVAVYMTKC